MRLLLLSICFVLVSCNRKPRVYQINLDEEPEERWRKVVEDFKPYIPYLNQEIKNHFVYPFGQLLCWLCEKLALSFPQEYYREMSGIANLSGLEFCHVVGLNILYDVTNFNNFIGASQFACSSIIAEDAKGNILHGRNLDYMMDDLMRNISIIVDFTHNQKVVYSAITFAFFAGITTGQRPNAFTLSLNARRTGWYILNVLMQIYTSFHMPTGFALRQTLERAESYQEALEDLTKRHFVSPSYLILGGTKSGEGALITRDRWSAYDVVELDAKKGRFFIVETNFDHWNKDEDGRRTSAEQNLLAVGIERLDESYMLAVLSTAPVTNYWTVTTSVMSAARPQMYYETTMIRVPVE
uniref:N-acylethanolamine-hydrolyzing acid amidase n=2 Tax=Ascaris TaxID=6251 RepID=A0A0M3HPV5_ASCLU